MVKKTIPKKIVKAVKEYINILEKDHLPIDQVFVFGSYAKGTQSRWSDIDVCVVSPKFADAWTALQYLWRHVPSGHNPRYPSIEPLGFNPHDFAENSSLISEIKRHGVLVH